MHTSIYLYKIRLVFMYENKSPKYIDIEDINNHTLLRLRDLRQYLYIEDKSKFIISYKYNTTQYLENTLLSNILIESSTSTIIIRLELVDTINIIFKSLRGPLSDPIPITYGESKQVTLENLRKTVASIDIYNDMIYKSKKYLPNIRIHELPDLNKNNNIFIIIWSPINVYRPILETIINRSIFNHDENVIDYLTSIDTDEILKYYIIKHRTHFITYIDPSNRFYDMYIKLAIDLEPSLLVDPLIKSRASHIISDPLIILNALNKNASLLKYVPTEDPEIIIKCINTDPLLLKYVSEEFKSMHEDIIIEVLKKNVKALEFVSEDFKKRNEELVIKIIRSYPKILQFISDEFKDLHKDILIKAVRRDPTALQFVSNQFQNEHMDIIKNIIMFDITLIKYTTEEFKQTYPTMVINAIMRFNSLIKYISDEFQILHHEDIASIIRENTALLKYASSGLKQLHPELK